MPESQSYRLWKHWKRARHGGSPESSAALRDIWASIPGVHYPQEEDPALLHDEPGAPPDDWFNTADAARILQLSAWRTIVLLQGKGILHRGKHYYPPEVVNAVIHERETPPPGWCRRIEAIKRLNKSDASLHRHVLKGEIRTLRSLAGKYKYYNIEDLTRHARRR